MGRCLSGRRALAAGLVLLAHPLAAIARAPTGATHLKANAADLFQVAETLDQRGTPRRAEPILALLARDPDPEVRHEARFRLALLMESSGRLRGAAVLLRQILDERADVPAVRIKLATLLHKLGDEDAARRELRAVRAATLPPTVARFVDRLSASLQASKPLGFHVELALAPDSNINRSTRSDTLGTIFGDFTLDPGSQAKSGLGAAVRGLAQARVPLAANLDLTARAGGDANLYRDKDFNDISLDLSAGPDWRLGRTRLTAEVGLGQAWFAMKPYQRTARIAGSATRPIGPAAQARLDVAARWSDNRVNDLQDGRGVSARLRYERALSPTMLVSAFVGGDRFKARDDAYSTRAWTVGLTGHREVGRATLFAGFEFGRLKADDRLALLLEAREDRLVRYHAGAVFRHLTVAGFAPMTRLVIERNRSNVEYHDYRRVRSEFGISRAF